MKLPGCYRKKRTHMKIYKPSGHIVIMDRRDSIGIDVFQKVEAIQVLYYLEDHNPNVTLDKLSAELNLGSSVLVGILKDLLKHELIEYSENRKQYSLTEYGRNIAKTLHEVSQN